MKIIRDYLSCAILSLWVSLPPLFIIKMGNKDDVMRSAVIQWKDVTCDYSF